MTDSVAVITITDVSDEAGTQAELQAWLTNNVVTSVDRTDVIKSKRNRGLAVIWYTA